jgi:tetratricopeptide (TPR) repeat protein/predicted ATPase
MARERRSLQDRIRERQRSGFTGRQGQVMQYQENLALPVDDERRRFLFNIHGNAGVGKTFLARQLQQVAAGIGAVTAYADETAEDVAAVMSVVAAELGRGGSRLGEFDKRLAEYQQRRHELESDPNAPDGIAAFLTRTAVTVGLAAARDIPVAGSLLATVDAAAAAEQANRAREYLTRKFADHSVTRLLLSPAEELTPAFVAGLCRAAADRPVALFFDTYERTGLVLDRWLRDLYAGRYGDLPETLVTTISGQRPLDPNRWGEYLPVIADVPLEPFSDAEARQFLASKNVTDEAVIEVILALSGRLPLWLATLAGARPQGTADIGDPTGNAVERFLKWEDDPGRREAAIAAALPRALNQDVLAVLVPGEARELFAWLREMPFVSPRGGAWAYHDVVRAAMLRLRRAEAPAEWRSQHEALAQASARRAGEAVTGPDDDPWDSPGWIEHAREEAYHLLCSDPHRHLATALASAVMAARHDVAHARQWALLLADAGRDVGSDSICGLGQRLADSIRGDDLTAYFTCLITDGGLGGDAIADALVSRSDLHRRAEHYDEALADGARAVGINPVTCDAILVRGLAYLPLGRYEEALADFNRAIEVNPQDPWAIGSRGETYLKLGRNDEAVADYTRAIELDPEDTWAIRSRAEAYKELGRHDEAVADYTRAIELDPEDTWAIGRRGEACRELGRYDEALADLSRAIELDPEDPWPVGCRGQAYREHGRHDEALADYSRTIELDPEDGWAIVERGQVYQELGRYDEALADLSRAIELDPGDLLALIIRAETYQELGRYDEAVADYNRAVSVNPGDMHPLIFRGQFHWAAKQYDEALADYARAAALSGLAWIIAERAEICEAAGRYDDALADISRAIELNPGEDRYAMIRAEILQAMHG